MGAAFLLWLEEYVYGRGMPHLLLHSEHRPETVSDDHGGRSGAQVPVCKGVNRIRKG